MMALLIAGVRYPALMVADSYCPASLRLSLRLRPLFVLLLVGLLSVLHPAQAEFDLNFQIKNQGSGYNDGYWSSSIYHSIGVDNKFGPDSLSNQTPWVHTDNWHLPEIVYDSSNGKRYYHVLFGSLDEGFMQEYFIEVATASGYWGGQDNSASSKDTPGSASGGEGNYLVGGNGVVDRWGTPTGGNGSDPLGTDPSIDSGNGSGNPNRVIMRQVVTDGEILMEFVKDGYNKKPRITQILNSPDMVQVFDMDMRQIGYDDKNTKAPMVNVMWLWGEGVPGYSDITDVGAIAQNSFITGGQYSYSDGAGPGGSSGTYDYVSGVFDHVNQSWIDFVDPNVNNPWSFESAKTADYFK